MKSFWIGLIADSETVGQCELKNRSKEKQFEKFFKNQFERAGCGGAYQ